jgi:CheY-like chemotaxis protein
MKNRKIDCIMLVDDNPHDNFFHERAIAQYDPAVRVLKMESAVDALAYLESPSQGDTDPRPDLIFLDINMPYMNGWEFLEEYKKLDGGYKGHTIIVMLSTSEPPSKMELEANGDVVSDFVTKPLTREALEGIGKRFFEGLDVPNVD